MILKTIIIDDEPLAVSVLENYCKEIQEIEVLQTFNNAVAAATFVQEQQPDLIFLDINMPILDGLSFLKSLVVKPMVIMTTAYESHALESFELQAIDYLVKPIPFPRFLSAVQRVIALSNGWQNPEKKLDAHKSIFVKVDKKKLQKIDLNSIVLIESLKDYIRIKTDQGKYIIHKTLSSFTEELPSDKFIRIHRSFTIAIDRVEAVEGNSLEIQGQRLTIGRSYITEVKARILQNLIS
ncbi:MAG: response regulator transcription factor [Flavobacteriaceae bacterium]|jgi:DNA-binding LytR/AlgR family response regulator|nr:response regulator transcription factor [Flavobacteriaceae bacterium LSUCC0859]